MTNMKRARLPYFLTSVIYVYFRVICTQCYKCVLSMQVVGWKRVVVVYVESIARVKKLSLTGLLLYKLRLADQFFVQWQDLKVKYPRANYVGRLM